MLVNEIVFFISRCYYKYNTCPIAKGFFDQWNITFCDAGVHQQEQAKMYIVDRTRIITETYNNTRKTKAEQEGLALSYVMH